MQYLSFIIPGIVIIIGAIVHIEVSIGVLKNDVRWIKQYLNKESGDEK